MIRDLITAGLVFVLIVACAMHIALLYKRLEDMHTLLKDLSRRLASLEHSGFQHLGDTSHYD